MSIAIATTRPRTPMRHLAWLPAVALIAWGVLAAAGVPIAPNSNAAGASITVDATVGADIHTGGTCAANPTYTDAALAIGDTSIGACTLTFGSNNAAVGSLLKVEHARPSGNAFCQAAVGVACGANPSFTNATGTGALAGGAFGVKVANAPTCTTPTWTNGNYYGVRDATTAPGTGDTVCSMTGNGDGSYDLEFRANRVVGTTSGNYLTQINFTAEAV